MTLEEHLKNLKQQQRKAEADYHAISGAIQFCQQLIDEQKQEEETDEH